MWVLSRSFASLWMTNVSLGYASRSLVPQTIDTKLVCSRSLKMPCYIQQLYSDEEKYSFIMQK